MKVHGHCHCGAISFTAEVDPAKVIVCHCEDCQTISGAPFRAVVPAPAAQFSLHGQPRRYVKVAASGNRRVQAFCGECGTQLFAADPENPQSYNLRLGCIAERAQLVPQVQVWGQSAMPWLPQLAELPLHAQGLGSPVIDH
jgi:hypothetical protein